MKYYIYALVTDNTIFYIGRTIDPKRRLKEHQRDSKTGDELKYIFIRQLTECGGAWEMQILAEYSDDKENYEDYHIYNAILSGVHLTNMRAGSIYTEAESYMTKEGKKFNTPLEFFEHREELAKQLLLSKQNLSKKCTFFTDETRTRNAIGHVEVESAGLRAIRERLKSKKRKYE